LARRRIDEFVGDFLIDFGRHPIKRFFIWPCAKKLFYLDSMGCSAEAVILRCNWAKSVI
jgi:hypothetical protein